MAKIYIDGGKEKVSNANASWEQELTGDKEVVLSKGYFSVSEGGSLYSNPLFRLKNITICRSWQLIKNILKQCVG